jgi:hypothetical protein
VSRLASRACDSFKLFSTVEGYSASSERKSLSILKAAARAVF